MVSVVAFNGSPRKNGHCSRIIEEVTRGVKSKGGMVKLYDMNTPDIKGCQGCFHCRNNPECPIEDAFQPVYADIQKASGIVFASPIYFAGITSQAKKCIDRLFPALSGKSHHPRWPGKRVVTIFSQGDHNMQRFRTAVEAVHGFFVTFGWKSCETIICGGASTAGYAIPVKVLDDAFMVGTYLAE